MNRRSVQNNDSLDLLLDTITNTFGGIVFLAMLIVLLMGTSQPTPSISDVPALDTDFKSMMTRIESLQQQHNELAQLQAAQEVVKSMSNLDDSKHLVNELKDVAALFESNQQLLSHAIELRQEKFEELRQLAIDVQQAKTQLSAIRSEKREVTASLKKTIREHTQPLDLPKERSTQKRQTVLIVAEKKIFVLDKTGGSQPFQVNSNHFESCALSDARIVLSTGPLRNRTSSGIGLNDTPGIEKALSVFNADSVFLTIPVWNDSFDGFHNLRDVCRDLRLEYQLIPMLPDAIISETTRVTDPKVQ